MTGTVREYCASRGARGVVILLYSDPQRFTGLAEMLHISDPTLTYRLVKACGLGLVTLGIDEQQTSIGNQYRLSERGALIMKKVEQSGVTRMYRIALDMHQQVEDGHSDLTSS